MLDTPNLALINFSVLGTFRGRHSGKKHPEYQLKFQKIGRKLGKIVLILRSLNIKLPLGHLLVGVPPSPFKGEVDGFSEEIQDTGFGLMGQNAAILLRA